LGGTSILVAHNHPSGDPKPSPADLAITRRLQKAAEVLDISIVGHLVLGEDGHYASIATFWTNGTPAPASQGTAFVDNDALG